MDEKGVSLAILGVVAVIAVVGLVLLFSGAKTGNASRDYTISKISSTDRGHISEENRFGGPRDGYAELKVCDFEDGEVLVAGLRNAKNLESHTDPAKRYTCRSSDVDTGKFCCKLVY